MRRVAFETLGASVTGYLRESSSSTAHRRRPAVLIAPGGAYEYRSPREADPIALEFSAMGWQSFLLDYAGGEEAADYRPLRQAAAAMQQLRAHADDWDIEPTQIALLGFSAGGHLAASLGVYWNDPALKLPQGCRPDALVLCYPVITLFGESCHERSADLVSGGDPLVREKLSLERHVGPDMPPTFIWHAMGDVSVPPENSLLLMDAMRRAGVDFEAHLFAGGAHGISTCNVEVNTPEPHCAPWVELCKAWLNRQFSYNP